MTSYAARPEPKSSATFCTRAPSSICDICTLMPVRLVNADESAAMAALGEVFSEMKLIVVPENCFQSAVPPEEGAPEGAEDLLPDEPQAVSRLGIPSPAAPTSAPLRTLRRVTRAVFRPSTPMAILPISVHDRPANRHHLVGTAPVAGATVG